MRRLRDIVYINSNLEDQTVCYYGIEFKEFIPALNKPIDNILLLKHQYWDAEFHYPSRLEYLNTSGITGLTEENVYNYGDFCWIDFEAEDAIDLLEAEEIAELLYLGHLHKPLNSAFSSKLKNRFAYCAHDDGWHCLLYCKDIYDFTHVIASSIIKTVATSKRRKIYPLPDEIKNYLLQLSQNGLLLGFDKIYKDSKTIEFPIYTIGKFTNMDQMYNDLERHIGKSNFRAALVHKNKTWTIEKRF